MQFVCSLLALIKALTALFLSTKSSSNFKSKVLIYKLFSNFKLEHFRGNPALITPQNYPGTDYPRKTDLNYFRWLRDYDRWVRPGLR